MLLSIFLFEVRYQLKNPVFPIACFLFFVLTFGAVTTDSVIIGGGIGNVNRNAPYVIMQLLTMMMIVGIFAITAFVAGAIHRDFEHRTNELFFTTPVRKFDYMVGRFLGSTTVALGVAAASALGILVGSLMPWLEPERIGAFTIVPYAYTFFLFVIPNTLFVGSIFFTLAALTRSMLFTYLGVVIFFVIYSIANALSGDMENEAVASLLDPFGLACQEYATRYWTIVERNSQVPELGGEILINRLIWLGAGLAVFAIGYFAFNHEPKRRKKSLKREAEMQAVEGTVLPGGLVARFTRPSFGSAVFLRQYRRQALHETVAVLRSIPYLVILAFGVLNVVGSSDSMQHRFGTSVYPVTQLMLQNLANSFSFLLIIIITFYAGELIWRERTLKMHEIYDALPVPDWVPFAAKLTALLAVTVVFLFFGILASVGIQIYKGYFNLEPLLYLKGLAVEGYPFILSCVLAIFVQLLSKNRFIGYMIMVVYMISRIVLALVDFNHQLYHFGGLGGTPYSDMNGYGHFLVRASWLALYWTLGAALLALLSLTLWRRGTENSLKSSLRNAGERCKGGLRLAMVLLFVGFVAAGAWVFYNTNILNEYVPGDEARERMADYEKQYRRYLDAPQPKVTAVYAEVDIFPKERNVDIRGTYTLENNWERAIDSLHLTLHPMMTIRTIDLPGKGLVHEDSRLGYYIYELESPLGPGEELEFSFDVAVETHGFLNHGSNARIAHNGTFFDNQGYFPTIGYSESNQLVDRNRRRQNDLSPVERMPKIDDREARRNNCLTRDSDWIDFEAVVSTSPEQIAMAPGYLQREWEENGRRYFHYKMDAPMMNYYAFLSAEYEVKRDQWNDVAIEVYYHKGHEYNVDRMIYATKKSLEYFSDAYSPYQHRQMRILEFPGYNSFAQSFANTVPFSESIGFIANLEEEEDIDYVFYVTAHEVAHQWWAHQVLGANVQGASFLAETLSQYSALMVMELELGADKMRRFLQYELDRYLRGRAGELVEELPILLVEHQQYIHYQKGSIVMYALRDYLGRETVDKALADYVEQVAFQDPPWTISLELFDLFEAATPDSMRGLLEDLFETITLYENRVVEASCSETDDGRYVVTIETETKKVRADGQGVENEVAMNDWIDVGIFCDHDVKGKSEEKVLYMKKHRITGGNPTFTIEVDEKPLRVGIDPYNKLVDRNSGDNVRKVSYLSRRGA